MKLKAEAQVRYNDSRSSAFSFSTIKDAIHFSNLHVGLITAAVSFIIPLLRDLPILPNCHLFIYLSTVFIYNFDHRRISIGDQTNSPERCHWIKKNKKRLLYSDTIGFLCCLSLLYSSNLNTAIAAIGLLLICALYSTSNLIKGAPGIKNLIIASIWAFTCISLPCLWYDTMQNQEVLSLLCYCGLIAFVNAILFDIKDLNGDKLNGTRSLPVLLGVQKAKYLTGLLSLALLPLCILDNKLLGFSLVALFYLLLSLRNKIPHKLLLDFILLLALIGFL